MSHQRILHATLLAALLGVAGLASAQNPGPTAASTTPPNSREDVKAEARVQNRNNANTMVPKGEATTTVNHAPNAMPQPSGEMSRAEVSQTGRKVKPQFGNKGERPEVATNPTDKTGTPK